MQIADDGREENEFLKLTRDLDLDLMKSTLVPQIDKTATDISLH